MVTSGCIVLPFNAANIVGGREYYEKENMVIDVYCGYHAFQFVSER